MAENVSVLSESEVLVILVIPDVDSTATNNLLWHKIIYSRRYGK
jgi:hypothetical protein